MAYLLNDLCRCAQFDKHVVDGVVCEALIECPNNYNILSKCAELLYLSGKPGLALKVIERIGGRLLDARPVMMMAEILDSMNDHEAALTQYWQAVSIDPFAFKAFIRIAEIELKFGDRESALTIVNKLIAMQHHTPDFHARLAQILWQNGNAAGSVAQFEKAYLGGVRDESFLTAYIEILTGETLYEKVLELPVFGESGSKLNDYNLRLRGHARLALTTDRESVLLSAKEREQTERWLHPNIVVKKLQEAIDNRNPFSLVRFGDGEARFLIWAAKHYGKDIPPDEFLTVGEVPWRNWFNANIADLGDDEIKMLDESLRYTMRRSDILGVSSYDRLRIDTGHYGYLSLQEYIIGEEICDCNNFLFDALANFELEKANPPLRSLLKGLDFLGIISPHTDIETRIRTAFAPKEVVSFVIPGEARLHSQQNLKDNHRHYPEVFQSIMENITVPHKGAVFLVGAGLLGKIYCTRIKDLGGIAIDVGSLVDGWVGIDTRPGFTSNMAPLN